MKFGISFTTTFFNQAGALVLVYRDGSVQVNHGGTEMGQGLHTKMLQIAADALGVPTRRDPADADAHRQGAEHVGDGGVERLGPERRGGAARVRDAARAARRDRRARASASTRPRVVFAGGRVHPRGAPERGVAVRARSWARPTWRASRCSRPASTARRASPSTGQTGAGTPFHYFAYGAAVSEVEVDGFTGQYRLLRVDILHDVGDSLSPLVDRGQIEGGFVQGVGWLTCEELVWNERRRVPVRTARRPTRCRRWASARPICASRSSSAPPSPASSTAARRSASRR